jgi:hypothetical protein
MKMNVSHITFVAKSGKEISLSIEEMKEIYRYLHNILGEDDPNARNINNYDDSLRYVKYDFYDIPDCNQCRFGTNK